MLMIKILFLFLVMVLCLCMTVALTQSVNKDRRPMDRIVDLIAGAISVALIFVCLRMLMGGF